jgi:uncharacterized protein (TIGR02145 family)
MKLLITTTCCWLVLSLNAQMIGLTVEVDTAFYAPTGNGFDQEGLLNGYVSYDVYAVFANETDELSAIYSDALALGTEPFYVDAPCGCFNPLLGDVLLGASQNPGLLSFFPEIAYDTYWTLGFAPGEQIVNTNPDYSSTTMCSEQESGGSIYTIAPVEAGPDMRIQIAQVTTCGSFSLHACFQVFIEGDQGNIELWCMEGDGNGPETVQNPCENYVETNANITVNSSIDCFGDLASVDVNVAGASPITYELFDALDLTLVTTQLDDNEFNGITEGDYFVAVIDGNTCRDSSEVFSFVEPEKLLADWELLQDNSCGELTSAVGVEYSGGTPNYQIAAYSATNSGPGLIPDPNNQWLGLDCVNGNGTWEFEIEDANGCAVDTIFTITCTEPVEFYNCDGTCVLDSDGDGICDELEILGCTTDNAENFDPSATEDDGSCIIFGCIIEIACNYDQTATVDDGSCEFYCPGCTVEDACNYDELAIQDDGSCEFPPFAYDCSGNCLQDSDGDLICDELEIHGCTIDVACNFDASATEEDGSCIYGVGPGYDCDGNCIYDSDQDGVCDEFEVAGCQDATACNFEVNATDEDGSCEYPEPFYFCDGSCINDTDNDNICDELEVPGCTSNDACNFNILATDDDGLCEFPEVGYDCEGNCLEDADGDGICDEFEVAGCTDDSACNFSVEATNEDGSCEFETCAGCTYPFACNYDPTATIADNSTCEFGTCPGCTDFLACNFNPTVTEDDGSCDYTSCVGCMDSEACNYDPDVITDDGSCEYISCTIPGCIDSNACNFDPEAGYDDGSCLTFDSCGVCGGEGIASEACDCEGNTPEIGFDCDGNCLSDLNENGICDIIELTNIQEEIDSLQNQIDLGAYCGQGTTWDEGIGECVSSNSCPQDLDGDGVIGVDDLLLLLGAYGTACEPQTSAWTCGDPMNYHGYDYATVQIGEQCWFAENLRSEHYANGDAIPGELSDGEWSSTTNGAQAIFANDASNLTDYGRLYNWFAVDDARGLCPSGWHVPSDEEYTTLTDGLGGTSVAGGKMKSSPEDSPAWNGTNTSGFSGLAGGDRNANGGFYDGGYCGCFWSASANGTDAWLRVLVANYTGVYRNYDSLRNGFSVRCVRD